MSLQLDESCLLPHLRMPKRFADFCVYVRELRNAAGAEPATELELQRAFDAVWTAFP